MEPVSPTPARRSATAWLSSLARPRPVPAPSGAVPLAEEPPLAGEEAAPRGLAHLSPFTIGFFGTGGAMAAYGLVLALVEVRSILLLVVVSLFLALGLSPVVEWLTQRRLNRNLAVLLVAVGVLGLLTLAGLALVPLLTEQVNSLITATPDYLRRLQANPDVARLDARYGVLAKISDVLASRTLFDTLFGGILGAGKLVASTLLAFIVTLVLTVYFLASLPTIKESIYRLAPRSRRGRVRFLANAMFSRISGYLTGMFVVVTVAATCAFIFMMIAGLGEYALALAFVVAMFAFIPLIGSTCSMIVVALVGFSVRPAIGIAAIIYFLIYQQFEAYIIQPRVMQRSVNVPGAMVVVAALAGGTLLGIVGALIAIPSAAALLLLYREVLLPHLDSR